MYAGGRARMAPRLRRHPAEPLAGLESKSELVSA
jgi:hypothetical protein